MTRLACLVVLTLGLLSFSTPGTSGARPAAGAPAARAQELKRGARSALFEASAEGRRRAIRMLEEAVSLEPDDPTLWHLLGEAYASARYGTRSRACFEHALSIEPRDAGSWFLSGMAWRREWLLRLDPSALDRAIAAFDSCTRLDPDHGAGWLRLSALLYERRDPDAAFAAAERSKDLGPFPDQNLLARAYLAFRTGDLARADTLFARVIPRLEPFARRLFDKPWIVLEGSADPRAGGPAPPRRHQTPFWETRDPDPTTPENEFRLEYWARAAHALLLFEDPVEPRFDGRAMTYVQYGPPATVTLQDGSFQAIKMLFRDEHSRSLAEYPFITQVWDYPQYGMRIRLDDKALVGRYERRTRHADDPTSSPAEAALRAQPDVVAIDGGAALFTARPPKSQRLQLLTLHSRFEGGRWTRLSSQVRVGATGADSAVARWLVVDSTGREVARQVQALDRSACVPESLRIARFSAELRPGNYQVFVSASDRRHRRAAHQSNISIADAPRTVALSDIVSACSEPSTQIQGNTVQLEADEVPRVRAEQPLSCYFEISGLTSSSPGPTRFQYRYRLQRLADEGGADAGAVVGPVLREYASEEIEVDGPLRRQFVAVPMRTLPEARYRLTIRVRDLASGLEAERSLDFAKD